MVKDCRGLPLRSIGNRARQQHASHTSSKHSAAIGKKNLNALKVLSSLTDTSAHILKRVYSACVQSGLDYGAILTPLMCKTSIPKLQRVQNQGMRLILGAPKWTCTTS